MPVHSAVEQLLSNMSVSEVSRDHLVNRNWGNWGDTYTFDNINMVRSPELRRSFVDYANAPVDLVFTQHNSRSNILLSPEAQTGLDELPSHFATTKLDSAHLGVETSTSLPPPSSPRLGRTHSRQGVRSYSHSPDPYPALRKPKSCGDMDSTATGNVRHTTGSIKRRQQYLPQAHSSPLFTFPHSTVHNYGNNSSNGTATPNIRRTSSNELVQPYSVRKGDRNITFTAGGFIESLD